MNFLYSGQCHSVTGLEEVAAYEDYLKNGFAYRAGKELAASRHVYRGTDDSTKNVRKVFPHFLENRFWSDGMVRVSGREYNGLIESPCYQHGDESRGVLSCLSCHQMHVDAEDPRPWKEWANDQLAPKMESRQACIQCHEQFNDQDTLTAHTHHAAASTGSDCYNCHMPHTTWGLLKSIRSHQVDSPSVKATLKTGRPNACNLCHLDKTLAWTDRTLGDWYGHPRSLLSGDQEKVAASILWMLTGDAGQRAIAAWHVRWGPAREISGTDWIAPYLSEMLLDPYPAVRYTAHESLKSLPGFEKFEFDFVGPERERDRARTAVREQWARALGSGPSRAPLLLDGESGLDWDAFKRLSKKRNDRRVDLSE